MIDEFRPWKDAQTDDEWVSCLRGKASGSYHPWGTCNMGVDAAAVVPPDLSIIGVDCLGVVDSSIIPEIPSENLNVISMAIGENGADMILEARKRRAMV